MDPTASRSRDALRGELCMWALSGQLPFTFSYRFVRTLARTLMTCIAEPGGHKCRLKHFMRFEVENVALTERMTNMKSRPSGGHKARNSWKMAEVDELKRYKLIPR